MSWDCVVLPVKVIKSISGADTIELAVVGDNFPVVVRKGDFKVGDKVSYFPEDSIIPDNLLNEMGLGGKLSGSKKNRVKPVVLKNQLSIGLIHKAPDGFNIGDSVAKYYNIERYEEEIPAQFSDVNVKKPSSFISYDIDNIRKECYLNDGEECVVSIKMHGTFSGFHLDENNNFTISSKNLCVVSNGKSIYARIAREYDICNKLISLRSVLKFSEIWIYGETFGPSVQDLTYGVKTPTLNLFDIRIDRKFINYADFLNIAEILKIPTVRYIYTGPFNQKLIYDLANEDEAFFPCIREGVVVKPIIERLTHKYDRVINKCISDKYLMRKGKKTEHH